MASNNSNDLPILFLRTIWIFQAVLAAPSFIFLGLQSFASIYDRWNFIYLFARDFFSALLAGTVVLIVVVQRKIPATPKALTRNCELAKSALATVFWLWWFLDALLYTRQYGPPVATAVAHILIAVVLLLTAFYPALIFAWFFLKDDEGQIRLAEGEGSPAGETV